MLTLDQLLASAQTRERVVSVPGLGGEVRVQLLRQTEVRALLAEATVGGEVQQDRLERLLLQRGLVEPALDERAVEALTQGSAAVYYQLLMAVLEANGLTALTQREARRTFPPAAG